MCFLGPGGFVPLAPTEEAIAPEGAGEGENGDAPAEATLIAPPGDPEAPAVVLEAAEDVPHPWTMPVEGPPVTPEEDEMTDAPETSPASSFLTL